MNNLLILGGGYAGCLAAIRLAKRGIPVTLVDSGSGLVDRVRLHQLAAGDDIPVTPYSRLFRGLAVNVVRARVIAIDRDRKVVRVVTLLSRDAGEKVPQADEGGGRSPLRGASGETELPYDRLLYTLGSKSPKLAIPRGAKSVAIAGAGLTGIETAAEFAERFPDVRVTLVDERTIGGDLCEGARRHLVDWMRAHNVELRDNERADHADIWCTGFAVSPIAREAGLAVNERGQILVDDNLRSTDASIFAAGDAAAFRDVRMGCVSAMPMAAYGADYLAGATTEPFRFGFTIRCISLGRRDGIVQFVHADDSPRDRFLSGRPAAWVKEMICRYVLMSLRMERAGIHYSWPKTAAA